MPRLGLQQATLLMGTCTAVGLLAMLAPSLFGRRRSGPASTAVTRRPAAT